MSFHFGVNTESYSKEEWLGFHSEKFRKYLLLKDIFASPKYLILKES